MLKGEDKMGYRFVKAVCLFCDATVGGSEKYMLRGQTQHGKRGRIPQWLKDKPEHQWVWNGLGDAVFYLCPEHNDDEHYDKAFRWAEKHN